MNKEVGREIENPKIYAAIANVIADVGIVSKDKINKQQGFKYRSVDDVFNALHPALAKNKVFIVPRILEQTRDIIETRNGAKMTLVICKIKFTFYAEDGSYIESVIIGEGLDTGDKATNKAMAIAYKYACFQVFCIPTEEIDDPDAECPEIEDVEEKKANKLSGKTKMDKSAKKEETGTENAKSDVDKKVTQAMINTIHSELNRTGVAEKQILSMYKVKNLKDLTVMQFNGVMKKFQVTPDKEAVNE